MAALLVGALAAPAAAQEGSAFEWAGSISRGDELEVRGISGDIRVVLARGDRAEVTATKHGRSRDFEDVEIVAVETRDGIRVCAIYFPRGRAEDRCEDREHGNNGRWNDDIDVEVDFEVALPAGVDFRGVTVAGRIDVEDVRSDVRVNTVSGDITVSTSEIAQANTVNGEMDIEIGSTDWDELDFATVSGDITLTLPASAETEVRFASLSGDFDSDFDVRYTRKRDRWVGANIEGVIGDDRRSVAFKTVSGDVRLRRGS
ncbi:MAG: DUF4097 family beta strand repeat-containing protein [Gemmatimonadota bacterium]|nr:DUF4097 family beta strand repeat protein [Gemmatimonadota bacterium]